MPPLPFVLWDLDGTLIDSGTDIATAANLARTDLGLPPLPEATIRSYVGEGAARLIDQAVGEDAPEDIRRKGLERFFVRYGENLLVHTKAFPGIDAIVRQLRGRQAIATNKPAHFSRRIVAELGWDGCFRALVGGGDVEKRKPAPDAALRALEISSVGRSEAVFVGDSPIDMKTAEAAGIRFVAVSWGLRPRSELMAAQRIVDSSAELVETLAEMC